MTVRSWRIATRLLLAQAVVLLAAIATAGVIAAVIGPPLFHEHMLRANRSPNAAELRHIEEAYRTTSIIAIGLAIGVASVLAFAVSWYLTRRIQRGLLDITRAAARVSTGRYDARVPVGGIGAELDTLARAFNKMAADLEHTEDTRRTLLADLAHELRTPIATLTAYLEGVEDGVAHWNQETRAVLGDQVARLTRLAQDIDAVSRAEEGRLDLQHAPLSVRDLTRAAVTAQHDAYRAKGVRLSLVPGADVSVTADRDRLLQVLANLLDNARRHTHPGGSVSVEWDRRGLDAIIVVTDTGEGIPASQLPHIFERFYSGGTGRDRNQQGSGIGLTISRAIVQAHGGQLEASSEGRGAGSTFTVTVPIGP